MAKTGTKEILADLIRQMEKTIEMTRPIPVLGDEDSINLTQHQVGFIAGMTTAIRFIEQVDTTA